jgi:mannitol-1-phosphate/altronate dehydrogenase
VGAQFVADVSPYEAMKLRLLNASHLAVAGLGRLAGHTLVDECLRDPDLAAYMAALMDRETGPTVPSVPGIDLAAYKRTLLERFGNPAIRDTVERINADAPLNVLLDPIRDRLRDGAGRGAAGPRARRVAPPGARRGRGGQPIEMRHPLAARAAGARGRGRRDPRPLLGMEALFGDLGRGRAAGRDPWGAGSPRCTRRQPAHAGARAERTRLLTRAKARAASRARLDEGRRRSDVLS